MMGPKIIPSSVGASLGAQLRIFLTTFMLCPLLAEDVDDELLDTDGFL